MVPQNTTTGAMHTKVIQFGSFGITKTATKIINAVTAPTVDKLIIVFPPVFTVMYSSRPETSTHYPNTAYIHCIFLYKNYKLYLDI